VCWSAPLLGLAAAGYPLSPYLDFPPRAGQAAHAPFAWAAFAAISLLALGAVALFFIAIVRAQPEAAPARLAGRFPWWGILGLSLIAAGWFLAWNTAQRHTFTLLWLGYILLLNALVYRRAGYSLLTHRTAWFLALFPVSAAFWWLFEHLNQFVRNWYYSGVHTSDDWDYFVFPPCCPRWRVPGSGSGSLRGSRLLGCPPCAGIPASPGLRSAPARSL